MANTMRYQIMNKRIVAFHFVLIITVFFLLSCNTLNPKPESIAFDSGIYFDKNWDSNVGTYYGSVVLDKECAIAIATAIHDTLPDKEKEYRVPSSVFFDEEDDIWIVCFSRPTSEGVYWLGGDCCIALQKSDGKVVRIWYGE